MGKLLKATSEPRVAKSRVASTAVRDAKTGRIVTVEGVGALKDSDLKIRKGITLLKPIAEQALVRRN